MSNEKVVNRAAAAADPPVSDPPANPRSVISPEAMVEQLRVLRAQIPQYAQLTVADARSLRTLASLNPDFAQAAINSVGASPRVEAAVGQSAEELQAIAEAAGRWSTVEDELRAMLEGVSSGNLIRRHSLGRAALLTYAVSKKLVKEPEHADLLPHLAQMRRTNRLGHSRKSVAPQAPQPAPQPQAPAPAPTPEPSPSPAPNPTPASHV
jgi:hypothetical protein